MHEQITDHQKVNILLVDDQPAKLLAYALGRELGVADRSTVKAAVEHCRRNDYTLRSLVQFIVASEAFRTK